MAEVPRCRSCWAVLRFVRMTSGKAMPVNPVRDLRADLVAMLEQADVVYRLRGWSQSRGARVECALASLLGIPIEDAPDVEPTLESDLADGWDAWWREVDEVADRFERGRR